MSILIDTISYPVINVLNLLLQDKTMKQNIIWATDTYYHNGPEYQKDRPIEVNLISGMYSDIIRPRVEKAIGDQADRTKAKAEVFTPSWIVNKMNNHCDAEWFGYQDVFNVENDQAWKTHKRKAKFLKGKTWQDYIESTRIEITCGEAPYIVSRYDAATGEIIEIKNRIGLLDRKLRIINENVDNEEEWLEWVLKAYQSVYGYEFQGDNLLIARINLLNTFTDYLKDRWKREATQSELRKIANIIAWNFWQMDGITNTIPFGNAEPEERQMSIFDFVANPEEKTIKETPICRIYDWKANKSIPYTNLKR